MSFHSNLLAAACLTLATLSTPAAADQAIPSQDEWVAAKKFVTLPNGIHMAYVDIGNPEGAPVVMIHGYTDSSRTWSNMAPFMSDYRILAMDLRGHGATSAPACCYTMMEFSNDVSLFMAELGLEKADVLGHSLGASVAQTLAAMHPEQVDHLVLLAGAAGHARAPGGWLWENVMALEDPIDPESDFMNAWYGRPEPLNPPEMDIYGKQEAAAISADIWQAISRANMMTDLRFSDSLIEAPTYIVAGGKDGLMGPESQQILRDAIPHAEFTLVEAAGHGLFKEYPEMVAGMIKEFLGK